MIYDLIYLWYLFMIMYFFVNVNVLVSMLYGDWCRFFKSCEENLERLLGYFLLGEEWYNLLL